MGAGILFAGWAMGRVVALTGLGHPEVPARLRLVLALSLVTWMVGGLCAWWFAVGALSSRRLTRAAVVVALITVVAAFVLHPMVLMGAHGPPADRLRGGGDRGDQAGRYHHGMTATIMSPAPVRSTRARPDGRPGG
jgi:hypothetical protein